LRPPDTVATDGPTSFISETSKAPQGPCYPVTDGPSTHDNVTHTVTLRLSPVSVMSPGFLHDRT
jgi:hypothetical protein